MTLVQRYAAFTSDPAGGNPAGVVLDADDLDDVTMQRIAADVGYSETAFVLRDGRRPGQFGLRFFSPLAEVAFCGHATIATSVALADAGMAGPYRFDTMAGEIRVVTTTEPEGTRANLRSVPTHSVPVSSGALSEALDALGWAADDLNPTFPPHVAFAGNDHLVLAVKTRERLAALDYDFGALQALCAREGWTTLQLVWAESDELFHSRNPFPAGGVVEDPATGAAAAAFGGYLLQVGRLPGSKALGIVQGEDMGRPSRLDVFVDEVSRRVSVGGAAVPLSSEGIS